LPKENFIYRFIPKRAALFSSVEVFNCLYSNPHAVSANDLSQVHVPSNEPKSRPHTQLGGGAAQISPWTHAIFPLHKKQHPIYTDKHLKQ